MNLLELLKLHTKDKKELLEDYRKKEGEQSDNFRYLAMCLQAAKFAIEEVNHDKIVKALAALETFRALNLAQQKVPQERQKISSSL